METQNQFIVVTLCTQCTEQCLCFDSTMEVVSGPITYRGFQVQQIAEILQQTSRTAKPNFTQFPFKTATKLCVWFWRSDFSVARFLQSAVG